MTDGSAERNRILRALDFGNVDSESEPDLARRFVRTSDFDEFATSEIWLALGAKGTGKSALFELFAKFEDVARGLTPDGLADIWITSGTGFQDLSEVATGDIRELQSEDGYDHEKLWRLYIAVRAGLELNRSNLIPQGPLKELLVAVGKRKDLRIGPLLKSLWRLVVGNPPSEVSVAAGGASVTLKGGNRTLDVVTLLQDVQTTLEAEGKELWILFDKVDEIYPADRSERQRAIEGLFTASMGIRRTFPSIRPKLLLRTDIWRHLDFTNKSHLADKQITLKWSRDQITALLVKRAIASNQVWDYVANRFERLLDVPGIEQLTVAEREEILELILPPSAYPGQNEARTVDWLVTRITDAQGTVLPREAILLCKLAQKMQLESGGAAAADGLIGRDAMRSAFAELSKVRCDTYLAEFPELKAHFKRFEGQTTATFTKQELSELMAGLEPGGDDLLQEFFDIGILLPLRGDVRTATDFEIPRLYRVGLGLVIRGRA